jgi:hypothetical protein
MPTSKADDLVPTREALTILGMADPSSISRFVALGVLEPALRLPGKNGAFLFHRADIERLAAERAAS